MKIICMTTYISFLIQRYTLKIQKLGKFYFSGMGILQTFAKLYEPLLILKRPNVLLNANNRSWSVANWDLHYSCTYSICIQIKCPWFWPQIKVHYGKWAINFLQVNLPNPYLNKNCLLRLDRSMVSISMTSKLRKPDSACAKKDDENFEC